MDCHKFILMPGVWHGEGKIQLNMIEEELLFQTTWNVLEEDTSKKIQCIQEIQIDGLSENMKNEMLFFDITEQSFAVHMTNQNIDKIQGKGIIDNKTIAWEFTNSDRNFEGFEVYHLLEDGGYSLHAEFFTSDQFRTKILGKIWQKTFPDQIELKEKKEEEGL
jgi:hypothetical protein